MPYKRRPYKKKRQSRRPRIKRSPRVVPDTKVVKHRYCDYTYFNNGVGVATQSVYRANSLFDPDVTGIGHQPLGFDEWSIFYNHYLVTSCKITVKFISTGGALLNTAICGIQLADTNTSVPAPLTLLEQSKSKFKLLTASTAGQTCTVTSTYSPRKFFGIKDIGDNRSMLGALISTNPTEDAVFKVFCVPIDASIDTGTVNALVTIDYTAVYSERKTLIGT